MRIVNPTKDITVIDRKPITRSTRIEAVVCSIFRPLTTVRTARKMSLPKPVGKKVPIKPDAIYILNASAFEKPMLLALNNMFQLYALR
jgi:hypothetical protein